MDLDDYHNNFYAGIHAANMAGTWQAIVNGFAGVRCQNAQLRFKPSLPKAWNSYTFKLRYKGSVIKVHVERNAAEFTLLSGESATFYVNGKEIILSAGGTCCEEI
jgi:alpha,alpha-trehalose phosphorylase